MCVKILDLDKNHKQTTPLARPKCRPGGVCMHTREGLFWVNFLIVLVISSCLCCPMK